MEKIFQIIIHTLLQILLFMCIHELLVELADDLVGLKRNLNWGITLLFSSIGFYILTLLKAIWVVFKSLKQKSVMTTNILFLLAFIFFLRYSFTYSTIRSSIFLFSIGVGFFLGDYLFFRIFKSP